MKLYIFTGASRGLGAALAEALIDPGHRLICMARSKSPIALTAAFLRLTSAWPAERKILNISTGAAHKAYAGWSIYCATKAALVHFTRCLALEQQGQANGAKVVALAPGVIDTAMQEAVRRATPEEFAELPRFVALKESGQLPSPRDAAQRVLCYLERADFGNEPVVDIRML